MFTGIYCIGAGLGPALNILAIFLTARVLGFQPGFWRAAGAVLFGIILGVTRLERSTVKELNVIEP